MNVDSELLKKIIEGALLSYGEALSVDRLLSLFDEDDRPEKQQVLDALAELQKSVEERGFQLIEVGTGWRFQVNSDLAPWVNRLWDEKPQKYSRALLETLALIAYRQPLTRSDIEEVRGVAVSSHIIKTLAEREWIKVVGHRDVPGRPSLFATTRQFLDYFGLKSLEELPTLGELKDIESLNEKLQLEDDEVALEQDQIEEAKSADAPSETEIEANEAQGELIDETGLDTETVDGELENEKRESEEPEGEEPEDEKLDESQENSTPL